ncbi:replication initiation protein [Pseudomonadota bacterium]
MAMPSKAALIESLPHKPYCTDELGSLFIRGRLSAISRQYIQVNRHNMVTYLVFDIDRAGAALAWSDAHLPPPYWTAKNPRNGHAHICYKLLIPFPTSEAAHLEPIRYAAAIQSAFMQRLQADEGYAGLLTKNPLHPHWQTECWTEEGYSLDYLADFVDIRNHPKTGREATGLGRNCDTFDSVRHWAYKAIRDYWRPDYASSWEDAVLARCEAINMGYVTPMPYSEVKSIAKSIAKWTIKHFTPAKFSESQAVKGAKGGKRSKGGGRPVNQQSDAQLKPWEVLGISRATYYRKKDHKSE